MKLVYIVAALALIEYFIFVAMAGSARGRYGVAAPASHGHPLFDRYFRVQQNTVEQIVIFLPALFLCARFANEMLAVAGGVVFIVGRALYARGYVTDPAKRGPGFLLTIIANAVLLLAGLAGVIFAYD
jgi:glutathione S-transferase